MEKRVYEKENNSWWIALTSEFSDEQFSNYFHLNQSQFNEVHRLVQNSIYAEGCNAQKPIWMEEKRALFLR
jgi:hypothetical protein